MWEWSDDGHFRRWHAGQVHGWAMCRFLRLLEGVFDCWVFERFWPYHEALAPRRRPPDMTLDEMFAFLLQSHRDMSPDVILRDG